MLPTPEKRDDGGIEGVQNDSLTKNDLSSDAKTSFLKVPDLDEDVATADAAANTA
jgi:hypothetical protein